MFWFFVVLSCNQLLLLICALVNSLLRTSRHLSDQLQILNMLLNYKCVFFLKLDWKMFNKIA